MTADGGVEVWEAAPGSWRWRYAEPPPGQPDAGAVVDLPSSTDYADAQAAAAAARTAYPGVPVRVLPPVPPPAGRHGCRRAVLRSGVVLLAVLAAAVAVRSRTRRRAGRRVRR